MDSSTPRIPVPVSTGVAGAYGLSLSSSRSSPRARRDTILPTFETPHPSSLRPSSFFRAPGSFKSRREARPWITRWQSSSSCQLSRRFLPWLTLILLWFFIGFRLHIKWSDAGIQDDRVGRNESAHHATDRVPDENITNPKLHYQIGGESDRVSEQVSHRDALAEEDMAIIDPGGESRSKSASNKGARFGRVVGPFDEMERRVLATAGRIARRSPCSGRFGDFVRQKSFVVVFHELSMTGAPLAMLELASAIASCGGRVAAVVLNKRGGLYDELARRGIAVVRDKLAASWKAAARADLVVASSAACHPWIEQYFRHNRKGGERLIWWMMENRREYFERCKLSLGKARALVFLSATQERLWRSWATEDDVRVVLPPTIKVVSLSVSDALADAAGLNDAAGILNSSIEAERKRETLRGLVRGEMGLLPSDYLVVSLSSINPGKGQLLMLQAALVVAEDARKNFTQSAGASHSDETRVEMQPREGSKSESTRSLKVLIGSVGSKSNKPEYVEKIRELLGVHPSLAEMVLWAEATVHVAPLYAAADAYVINAQGIGETFGRVTVEAMAFRLPVLGTDAGGTREIVQGNVTGLLHPPGPAGIPVLAHNLHWLLAHPELGVEMGQKGRARVQDMYCQGPMYEAMAHVFVDSVQERGG